MNRKETIKKFRKHWEFLSLTGYKNKEIYLEVIGDSGIANDCYLCEYAETKEGIDCDHCPIYWPKLVDTDRLPCVSSFYGFWQNTDLSDEERKKLANIISRLPERCLLANIFQILRRKIKCLFMKQ